jgi:hypothetical protein
MQRSQRQKTVRSGPSPERRCARSQQAAGEHTRNHGTMTTRSEILERLPHRCEILPREPDDAEYDSGEPVHDSAEIGDCVFGLEHQRSPSRRQASHRS